MKFNKIMLLLSSFFIFANFEVSADELTDSVMRPAVTSRIETTAPTSSINTTDAKCTRQSWQGINPKVTVPEMTTNTATLCFDEFTVHYSGISKTPLWVTEHLTASRILQAQQIKRVNRFHVESQLPFEWQSQLADYKDPIYDRGHMAPSGDMSTKESQYQSFSLSNIAPQEGKNNREVWADVEMAVRVMTERQGEVYVVTGPIFATKEVDTLNDVMIPTHFYKAVYIPSKNIASAYVTANQPQKDLKIISLKELDTTAGIKTFPTLSENIRQQKVWLPTNANAASKSNRSQNTVNKKTSITEMGALKLGQKTAQYLLKQLMLP